MKSQKVKITLRENNFSEETKEQMWEIYKKYYTYTKESFMDRISGNNFYAFYTKGDRLVGFTGLRIDRFKFEGRRKLLVYYGQTVVDQGFRGKALTQRTGVKLCIKYFKDILFSDVYMWCDALTYRAYLVFAKTLEEYYPTYKEPTPGHIKRMMTYIGEQRYGENFQPESGTVEKPIDYVKDPSVKIRPAKLRDADINFYAHANPGYQQGNGLLTLAPMNRTNVSILFRRFIINPAKAIKQQVRAKRMATV